MKISLNEMLLQNASKDNKKIKIKIEQGKSYTGFILGDDAVKSYSILRKTGTGSAFFKLN